MIIPSINIDHPVKVLVLGAVCSGKTDEARSTINRFKYQKLRCMVFVPRKACGEDDEGAVLHHSREGGSFPANIFDGVEKAFKEVQDFGANVVIVEEAQFVSPGDLSLFVDLLNRAKISLILFALTSDFTRTAWPSIKKVQDQFEVFHLPAICSICKYPRAFSSLATCRSVIGKDSIKVDFSKEEGNELYLPACDPCWERAHQDYLPHPGAFSHEDYALAAITRNDILGKLHQNLGQAALLE